MLKTWAVEQDKRKNEFLLVPLYNGWVILGLGVIILQMDVQIRL